MSGKYIYTVITTPKEVFVKSVEEFSTKALFAALELSSSDQEVRVGPRMSKSDNTETFLRKKAHLARKCLACSEAIVYGEASDVCGKCFRDPLTNECEVCGRRLVGINYRYTCDRCVERLIQAC